MAKTELQKIYADAKLAFEKGDYPLAFDKLWKGGVTYFIAYSQRECWFTHAGSANYFWNTFLLDENIFKSVFESDAAEQLLYNYFSKHEIQVESLERKLAKEFPQVFIKAIRVNQVFLKPDRIESLKALPFKKEFQLHQKIWQKIYEIETEKWKGIQIELDSVSKFSFQDILSHCIIWLETNRFKDSSQKNIHHLARTYSFFIEFVLTNNITKDIEIKNADDFFLHFVKEIFSSFKNKNMITSSSISKLLNRISDWINFREHVLSQYSFDLNIELEQQDELIFFNSTPEGYYKWLLNGVRYELNSLNYLLQGNEFVEYLEKSERTEIPGKTEKDKQLNRHLLISKWATLLLLHDLGNEYFQIEKNKIESEKLLEPLLTYSFNKLVRYENSLKHHFETSQSWIEAFMKHINQSTNAGIRSEPFFLMTESEYIQKNRKALSLLPNDSTIEEALLLFSYTPSFNNDFNRFHQLYDVWQNPFVKIGETLFCPMIFFASNIWFYSFVQAALTYRKKPLSEETESMENEFAKRVEEKGWKVKLISTKEANEITGDVDIFVEDEGDVLFIQLKRTYFRLDIKDTYYESINSDAKASKQLNEAEMFLEQPNSIYQLKHKPFKWVVSTSFENIGEKINGCYKVNYFDILYALRNPEIKKLKDLITALEKDKNIKSFMATVYNTGLPNEFRQLVLEVVEPLTIFESNQYRQPIFSEDENKTREYNLLFEEALKLDSEGEENEALVLLGKCISKKPNDADAFAAIANILADMKVFDRSFIAFKKALELLPNDPFITRNFCNALFEAGQWYDGLLKAIEYHEKFPMLGNSKFFFEKSFEYCIKNGLLNSEQLVEVKTKWDNIN